MTTCRGGLPSNARAEDATAAMKSGYVVLVEADDAGILATQNYDEAALRALTLFI